MKEIQLAKGLRALVDDNDYDLINQYNWYVLERKMKHHTIIYTHRSLYNGSKWTSQLMHQLILGKSTTRIQIDHKDGNGLNNQRENLRFCTRSQNQWNGGSFNKNKSSKYKGVSRTKRGKEYRAIIYLNNKKISLGSYNLETDAAIAYNNAALKYFGEFARLNIIPDHP